MLMYLYICYFFTIIVAAYNSLFDALEVSSFMTNSKFLFQERWARTVLWRSALPSPTSLKKVILLHTVEINSSKTYLKYSQVLN